FDGTPILTEWAYDGVTGRLDHNTRPYFAGASTVSIKYFYDAIGRNTSVQSPNAAGNGYDVSTTVYDGQTTTFTNAKNQTRVEVRNGLGKLKSVTDDS